MRCSPSKDAARCGRKHALIPAVTGQNSESPLALEEIKTKTHSVAKKGELQNSSGVFSRLTVVRTEEHAEVDNAEQTGHGQEDSVAAAEQTMSAIAAQLETERFIRTFVQERATARNPDWTSGEDLLLLPSVKLKRKPHNRGNQFARFDTDARRAKLDLVQKAQACKQPAN